MELSPISEKNTTKVNNTDDEMELAHEVCEENSTKMNNPEDEAYFEMLVADIIEDLWIKMSDITKNICFGCKFECPSQNDHDV